MPMPSANGIAMVDKEHSSSPSARKTMDELRRQVAKLKSELELERSKLKQVHRDRTNEIKRSQENYERERQKAIESVTKRLHNEHSVELRRVRDNTRREKDNELRQVVKFKDEELKAFKQQIIEEKDKNKRAEEELRRILTEKNKDDAGEHERRLRDEISDLKEQKHKSEENYRLKAAADFEKAELIRRMKSEHEREVNELIRQSKREVAKEFQQIRSVEKALEEKNHELSFKDQLTRRLEAEKQEIRQHRTSGEWSFAESPRRSQVGVGALNSTFIENSPEAEEVFGRANKDKERELRKNNAELQGKLDRLEKKCTLLEKQNASMDSGSQKASSLGEEKIKKLKKRNSELVSIARQLEEKAKKLQEEKNSVMKQANSKADPRAEVEHMKKMFGRQRAKDLAEHARAQMAKDDELESLRKELDSTFTIPEKENDKIEELQAIIKKTAKERLWLEKKLASEDSPSPSPFSLSHNDKVGLENRLEALEDERRHLKTSATKLKSAEDEALRLTKILKEKEEECEKLQQTLDEKQIKCSKLELERERFAAKCTILHQKNIELGKKVKEIKRMEEEISCLKEDLKEIEKEKNIAEQECRKLKGQVEKLLHFKEDFEASEDQRKALEVQHMSSLDKLNERDEEIKQLHKIQEESTRAHHLAVTTLERDVRSLEQKCAVTNEKYITVNNEVERLRARQTHSTHHKATQTSPEGHPSPTSEGSIGSSGRINVQEPSVQTGRSNLSHAEATSGSPSTHDVTGEGSQPDDDILVTAASRIKLLAMSDSDEDTLSGYRDQHAQRKNSKPTEDGDDDLAFLSRRITQAALSDNSTISASNDSDVSHSSMADSDMGDMEDNDESHGVTSIDDSIGPRMPATRDVEDSGQDSSAPEDEQLEDRGHVRAKRPIKSVRNKDECHEEGKVKDDTEDEDGIDEKYLQCEVISTEQEHLAVYIARYSYDPKQHSPNDCPDAELAFQAGDYLYVYGDIDEDGFFIGELMNGQRGLVPSNFIEKVADENEMTLMTNGTDEIYSSSDEEEIERKLHRNLRLNVEHIQDSKLGDIEEEEEDSGSITGESREVLYSQDGMTSDDTDLEPVRWYTDRQTGKRGSIKQASRLVATPDNTHCAVTNEAAGIPSPKRIALERQFTRSVLLNWKPADLPAEEVRGYGVYVNGEMRMLIKGSNRTKALIEDIDPNKTYRISVRTLTNRGEESIDQEAMLTIGKDASLAPSDVQVNSISPTSAKIEWIPGNSSYCHEVIVNGTPHRTIRPGTYQHTLTNLEPSEHYRVHIRAKRPNMSFNDEDNDVESDALATPVEFTTEIGGLPDPPLDVQLVPSSPRSSPNSLELTWIPVTITEEGTSNGARVTGYKVYINDIQCAEVTSPTADCVTVVPWMIERAVKKNKSDILQLYVRTQSLEDESMASNVIEIPLSTFNFRANRLIVNHSVGTPLQAKDHTDGSNGSDSGTELEDNSHNVSDLKQEEKPFEEAKDKERQDANTREVISRNDGIPIKDGSKIPESRTRGEPVVWKVNVEDEDSDSGDSNKSDFGGSSDEEESVEMCSFEPEHFSVKSIQNEQPETNGKGTKLRKVEETPYQQLGDDQEHDIPEADREAEEQQQDYGIPFTDLSRKMSIVSDVSDIDMDELNRSLSSAQSLQHERPETQGEEEDDKESCLHPLEFNDDSSEDMSLSVIQEEEEDGDDVTEPRQEASRTSQSTSEGFLSDDDVMDLLDEELEESQEHGKAVSAENVRRLSQQNIDTLRLAAVEPPSSEDDEKESLAQFLSSSKSPEEQVSNPSIESSERVLENINFEEGSTEGERSNTYSDIEADQTGAPHGTSTPLHDQAAVDTPTEYRPPESHLSEENLSAQSFTSQGGDGAGDRTFTLDVGNEVPEEDQGEMMIRIFIALYDYDPSTMSPNPDAEEEELVFSEGDLIKVYGDKDDDGFYWGECEGRGGFVPYNMVSEVQVDEDLLSSTDSTIAQVHEPPYPQEQAQAPQELNQEQPIEEAPSQYPEESSPMPQDSSTEYYEGDESTEDIGFVDPRNSLNYSLSPRKMISLFDYDPRTLSPNPDSEVELQFRVGDIIYVYGEMDDDGFFTGELNGVRGLVPSNFLEDLTDTVQQTPSTDVSIASQDSSPGPSKDSTPNGTPQMKEQTPKKKKGFLSKGKQMFKKMTKGQSHKK